MTAGFVDWFPEGKGMPYWEFWFKILFGGTFNHPETPVVLIKLTALFALPWTVAGWLMQAVLGVVRSGTTKLLTTGEQSSPPIGETRDGSL
ncbi:MAG: hypothetical protein ACRC7O_11515 [Fimbriiglobus sp.]